MSKGLDLSAIAGILDADKKQTAAKKASGTRRKRDISEPREYETWWKFYHALGDCENPECTDHRPHKVVEGNTMVAVVNDKTMCRICFLAGYNRTTDITEPLDTVSQGV